MRLIFLSILPVLLSLSSVLLAQSIAHTKPNVIIILADDLDSRQLSCYGGKNLKTTHIDQLAAEGMKFTNLYTSEAMCVPTRASLLTGLFPVRHGAFQNHKPVYDTLQSVVQYLSAEGYRVGLTGKDHCTKQKTVFPFDLVKGFEPNCVAVTDDYELSDVKEYITRNQQPYCLFVMSTNPHVPWTMGDTAEFNADQLVLPADWVDTKTTRRQFVKYLAEVRRLDNQVGDIATLLHETGQDKQTIFIFLGEQGAQVPGAKWNLWDSGQRSSMLVKWPGVVTPGSTSDALVQYEDITPTLLDIAGGKAKEGLDGKTFLPVLRNKKEGSRNYVYGIHNNIPEGTPYSIRSIRDTRYKLILNLTSDQKYYNRFMMDSVRKESNSIWLSWLAKAAQGDQQAAKIVHRFESRPAVEFYDTETDPYELNNLAGDPAYKKQMAQYREQLSLWMKQQGDPGKALDIVYPKK